MKIIRVFVAILMGIQPMLMPFATASGSPAQGTVAGFVVPNEIHEKEPFTLAAAGVVEGEVITIQKTDEDGKLEGEVVAKAKADKYGRLQVPAGLIIGFYLLSRSGGGAHSKFEVQPPRELPPNPGLDISNPPKICNVKQGLNLQGTGMSGDASQLSLDIGGKDVPVLASTPTELKTGPIQNPAFGHARVQVHNANSAKNGQVDDVFVYELTAKLARSTISSGGTTALEFTFKPSDTDADVKAGILSGPVSFAGGAKEQQTKIQKGSAKMPLVADPLGVGKFQVAYDLVSIAGVGAVLMEPDPNKKDDNAKDEPCPNVEHSTKHSGKWKATQDTWHNPSTGKDEIIYRASITLKCFVKSGCSKKKGHSGPCNFVAEKRCKDHADTTYTASFTTKEDRDKYIKDNP